METLSRFKPNHFEMFAKMKAHLSETPQERELLGECPLCGGNIKDRKITLFAGLIRSVHNIYEYLNKKGEHEFNIKEVKDFMGKNEYARFGDLVRFGGIIYKPEGKKGVFGMNMERTQSFFQGKYKIPVQITINQITNEIEHANYVTIYQFPELKDLLDNSGLYNAY